MIQVKVTKSGLLVYHHCFNTWVQAAAALTDVLRHLPSMDPTVVARMWMGGRGNEGGE